MDGRLIANDSIRKYKIETENLIIRREPGY
jgi:hypothetical protein